VTVPESNEHADGTLLAATRLEVTLADAGNTALVGTSTPVDVWVDSAAPTLTVNAPSGLCGSFDLSSTAVTQAVSFNAENGGVSVQLTNGSSTTTYNTPTFATGVATFSNVVFNTGENDLVVTATDPAGNSTTLTPNPCMVTVGAAPVVTFVKPVAGAVLCPTGSLNPGCVIDSQSGTPGWQGDVSVHVTVDGQPLTGVNVTFMVGTTTLGMPALDAGGNGTLTDVTLPNGTVTIVATTDNVPNHGVGTASVTVNVVDATPPTAVSGLQVSVTDRRKTTMRLTWTAPSDSGAAVSGYDIRYAKVPITASNFDDTTSTTVAVTYTGTPASPGQLDGIDVSPLYIENDYYFAVAALDAAGNRSPIAATPNPGTCTCLAGACCAAHFNTTVLTGLATTDHIGFDVSGSGDFGTAAGNGFAKDGFSDLVVGSAASKKVYLYFGSSSGYPASPSVAITGSVTGFGQGAIDAGDLDGDGLDDIAVTSPSDGTGKIYIFSRKNPPASWGSTTSWPATLTDTQANYTITLDATFAGTIPIRPLARLGNFDGAGADDLALGSRTHGTTGSVIVIKGSSSFGSITLPDATNTIQIDGPEATGGQFGFTVLGIGQFYPSAGPTFITSAVAASTLYAYRGQATVPSAPDDVVVGPTGQRYGATLGLLGPMFGSPAGVTVESQNGGYVDLFLATATDGPFVGASGSAPSPTVRFTDSAVANSFGVVNLGGGVPGTSQAVSLIGNDAVPDLVLGGQGESGMPIYLINGSQIPSMAASVNIFAASAAQQLSTQVTRIAGEIPTPWAGHSTGTVMVDSNGDSYPDFALGEFTATAAGRVVVFW
jgi:hypothetical protein